MDMSASVSNTDTENRAQQTAVSEQDTKSSAGEREAQAKLFQTKCCEASTQATDAKAASKATSGNTAVKGVVQSAQMRSIPSSANLIQVAQSSTDKASDVYARPKREAEEKIQSALKSLYQSAADEMRQAAQASAKPEQAISEQRQKVQQRIAQETQGKIGPEQLKTINAVISQAAQDVLDETPEHRTLEILRMQAARSEIALQIKEHGASSDVDGIAAARAERDKAFANFQSSALGIVSEKLAQMHLENVQKQQAAASGKDAKALQDQLAEAQAQLDTVKRQGKIPLNFTEEERQTAVAAVKAGYPDQELQGLFDAIGDAVQKNKTRTEKALDVQQDMQIRVAQQHLEHVWAKAQGMRNAETESAVQTALQQVERVKRGVPPAVFTDDELNEAKRWAKSEYANFEFDDYIDRIGNKFSDIRQEAAKLQEKVGPARAISNHEQLYVYLDSIRIGAASLTGLPPFLPKEDPVTAHYLKTNGVSIAEQKQASALDKLLSVYNSPMPAEQADHEALTSALNNFAHTNPVAFGLLSRMDVRFDTTGVVINGKPADLTPEQRLQLQKKDVASLSKSLLTSAHYDDKIRAELKNLASERYNYTARRVADLLKADNDTEALRTLSINMKATLTQGEAQILWADLGAKKFDQAYFDRRVDEFLQFHPQGGKDITAKLGAWIDDNFKDVPEQAARSLLSSIRRKISLKHENGSASFVNALSTLVNHAPSEAHDTAVWYTSVANNPRALRPLAYRSLFGSVVDKHRGTELAAAIDQLFIGNRSYGDPATGVAADALDADRLIKVSIPGLEAVKYDKHQTGSVSDDLIRKDPITATFIRALGVSANPDDATLSLQEQAVAKGSPLAFALFRKAGFRFETSNVNTTIVTRGEQHERVPLTPEQSEMLKKHEFFPLTSSLLSTTPFDDDTRALMMATSEARYTNTKQQVSQLLAAGRDAEALQVLKTNMDASFSSADANRLWADFGEPKFNKAYFEQHLDALLKEDSTGYALQIAGTRWLKSFQELPSQAAGYLLEAIRAKTKPYDFGNNLILLNTTFYASLSRFVEEAPSQGAETARWYAYAPDLPYGTVFTSDMEANQGTTLSEQILDRLNNWDTPDADQHLKDRVKVYAAQIKDQLSKALLEKIQDDNKERVKDIFAKFEKTKDITLGAYFDSFNVKGLPDIMAWTPAKGKEPAQTAAFNNMIGRAFNLVPTNVEAAERSDNTQNWFASGNQKLIVDLTAKVLQQEAGPGGQVHAIPAYLAGRHVGARNYTLFEVRKKTGELKGKPQWGPAKIIDGTALSNLLMSHPELIKADGNLVDDIDQKLYTNWRYDNFKAFQEENQLPDTSDLYVPRHSELTVNKDGHVDYVREDASIIVPGKRVLEIADVTFAVLGTVGGLMLAVPSGGMSLELTALGVSRLMWVGMEVGMAYGAARTVGEYYDMDKHGQSTSWRNPNMQLLYVSAGVQAMGFKSAFLSSRAKALMNAGSKWTDLTSQASSWLGHGSMVGGTLLALDQGYEIYENFDTMSIEQFTTQTLMAGSGIMNAGIGVHSTRQSRVGKELQERARQAVHAVRLDVEAVKAGKEPLLNVDTFDTRGFLTLDNDGAVSYISPENGRRVMLRDASGKIHVDLAPGDGERAKEAIRFLHEIAKDYKAAYEDLQEELNVEQAKSGSTENHDHDHSHDDHDHNHDDPDHVHLPIDITAKQQEQAQYIEALQTRMRINQEAAVKAASAPVSEAHRQQALREANTISQWAEHFGIDGPIRVSPWVKETVSALPLIAKIADLIHDIHAHQKPYDRRIGDHGRNLITRIGVLSRILLGDIPQCCGQFSHYSDPNAPHLTIEKAPILDVQNVQLFDRLNAVYKTWRDKINSLALSHPQLAQDIDEAVLLAKLDDNGGFLGDNAKESDISKPIIDVLEDERYKEEIRTLSPQTLKELSQVSRQLPHLALRGDLSLNGFNPGDPKSAAYIKSRLLENPGYYKFLGEVTIVKELVTAMLGDEGTWLKPKHLDTFKGALETFVKDGDVAALRQAIVTLRDGKTAEPTSEVFKTQLYKIRDAIDEGRAHDDLVRMTQDLSSDIQQWEEQRKNTLENFKAILKLADETGLGVVLHCDWGEAEYGEDGHIKAAVSDYRYFDELIDLVSQAPHANILLAHTGIGRFVRPDSEIVTYKYKTPYKDKDGREITEISVPKHIAKMEEALEKAPNLRFDISWNDVGEAYVKDQAMLDALVEFTGRHPQAIIFGSDTVKPVNRAQYLQAFTTLSPFFRKLAQTNRQAFKALIRNNYEEVVNDAEQRINKWTKGWHQKFENHMAEVQRQFQILENNNTREGIKENIENLRKAINRVQEDLPDMDYKFLEGVLKEKGLLDKTYFIRFKKRMEQVDEYLKPWEPGGKKYDTEEVLDINLLHDSVKRAQERIAWSKKALQDMQDRQTLLTQGRDKMTELADKELDDIADAVIAQPDFELVPPGGEQFWVRNESVPLKEDIYNTKALGTPLPRDPDGLSARALEGRFTSHGDPIARKLKKAAWLQTMQDVALIKEDLAVLGSSAALGAAATHVNAAGANGVVFGAVLRQFFFNTRVQYAEFVRQSWEEIFEKGNAHPDNVTIFLDRVVKTGKAIGLEEDRLKQVVELTINLQTDYNYINRLPLNEKWTKNEKDLATLGLVGLYQIGVDRALGVQSSSLNPLDSRTKLGRDVNRLIMSTSGASFASSSFNAYAALTSGQYSQGSLGIGIAISDLVAVTAMNYEAILRNLGGRTNEPLLRGYSKSKYANSTMYSGLASGGGLRVMLDIMNPVSSDRWLNAAIVAIDATVAQTATMGGLNEAKGASKRGMRRPRYGAFYSERLLFALALSNQIKSVLGTMKKYDESQENRKIIVERSSEPGQVIHPVSKTLLNEAATHVASFNLNMPGAKLLNQQAVPVWVNTPGGINLRAYPALDSKKLGAFREGSKLLPTGTIYTADNHEAWVEVIGKNADDGHPHIGWVRADYVEDGTQYPAQVNAAQNLPVYSGPSSRFEKRGTFSRGSRIHSKGKPVADDAGTKWIRVIGTSRWGREINGWVRADQIRQLSGE